MGIFVKSLTTFSNVPDANLTLTLCCGETDAIIY